jgi:hypothetical protein
MKQIKLSLLVNGLDISTVITLNTMKLTAAFELLDSQRGHTPLCLAVLSGPTVADVRRRVPLVLADLLAHAPYAEVLGVYDELVTVDAVARRCSVGRYMVTDWAQRSWFPAPRQWAEIGDGLVPLYLWREVVGWLRSSHIPGLDEDGCVDPEEGIGYPTDYDICVINGAVHAARRLLEPS